MVYVLIVLFGLAVGSFLNVVIYRLPGKISFVKGRSFCPHCKHALTAIDLIPLISFLLLRGRCRYCGKPIAWQYPLVELATAGAFLLFFLHEGFSIAFLVHLIFAAFLIVIFVIDFERYLILDVVSLPGILFAFLGSVFFLHEPLVSVLIAGILGGGFFLIQFVLSKGKWIGGGDIRLGVLSGFMLGLERFSLALVLAYIVGAFVGIVLILGGKKSWKSKMPFGTFLSASTLIFLLFGQQIADWFFSFYL